MKTNIQKQSMWRRPWHVSREARHAAAINSEFVRKHKIDMEYWRSIEDSAPEWSPNTSFSAEEIVNASKIIIGLGLIAYVALSLAGFL